MPTHCGVCAGMWARVRLLGVGGSLKGSGLNIHVHAWMRQRGHLGAAPSHHISAFQHAQVRCLASRYQRCTENLNHFNLLKIHPTKKCKHACRRTRSADKQLCKRGSGGFIFTPRHSISQNAKDAILLVLNCTGRDHAQPGWYKFWVSQMSP